MEMFVYLKKCFRLSGYLEFDGPNGRCIALALRLFGVLSSLHTITAAIWFVVLEPASFAEKTKSLEGAVCLGYIFSIHVILTLRRAEFFDMMELIEATVAKRSYKNCLAVAFGCGWLDFNSFLVAESGQATAITNVYTDTNDKIENMMRRAVSVGKVLFPLLIFPIMTQSYVEYYVLDRGEDAFKLTFQSS